MFSSIKRLLGLLDLALGYIVSAGMHIVLYVFSLCLFGLSLAGYVLGSFEGKLSYTEIDRLELLAFAAFLIVSLRFFMRGKLAGLSFWKRFKRYIFVSALSVTFCFAAYAVHLIILILEQGELDIGKIGMSDLDTNRDLMYFACSMFYTFMIYSFTPLPKLGWLTEKPEPVEQSELEKAIGTVPSKSTNNEPQQNLDNPQPLKKEKLTWKERKRIAKEEKNAKPVTALELALGESTEEVDKDIDKHTEQPSSDKLSEQDIESLHVQDTESTSSELEEKLEQEIEPISESEIENVFGQDDALKNHQEDEQEPKKEIEVDLQYEVNDSKQLERDDPSDKKVVEKSVEKLQTELKTPPIEESKQAPTLADFLADSTENPSTDSSNTNNKQ